MIIFSNILNISLRGRMNKQEKDTKHMKNYTDNHSIQCIQYLFAHLP